MKQIFAIFAALFIYQTQAHAIGEVILTCSSTDGAGFVYPIRRGTSNRNLLIKTATSTRGYGSHEYITSIWDGDQFDPSHVLILDQQGNRLIELVNGKLIDENGGEHESVYCAVDA